MPSGTLEQLKEDGIALHMIDLGGNVTGNGISKLVFTILSAVAENERDRIRERVRDAKRHRASQRLYNGGRRPFGLDIVRVDENTQRLVPNVNEQAASTKAKNLRQQEVSLRDIAQVWVKEFDLPLLDAKSIQRIIERVDVRPVE
jgi:DNA invertase Pin-like site-specific DNA recombinase